MNSRRLLVCGTPSFGAPCSRMSISKDSSAMNPFLNLRER